MRIAVADYGAGNLRSVCSAFARGGADPVVTNDLRDAPLAVVAGVGNAASAAVELERRGISEQLRERVAGDRPVLGICLGMQLLFGASEEGGSGLSLLGGEVVRLRARQVPHMGWNTLAVTGSQVLAGLDGADVYFAHSYTAAHAEAVVAVVEHDGPVVAAVERGALAGVQFHPERSGAAGARILANVLRWSSAA
ncbi:MAG TPA: imidazole glycerol phosphate synthase subunit HisH [Gaiellaceae bacterium]|nr:imidazole glycerol phosphate synthase subunit HisH [Gaiellaceae bacterium]